MQDKNPVDYDGYTPLHVAAAGGHFDICKMILEDMQKKKIGSIQGNSRIKFLKGLIHKLIVKNPKNYDGYTPLDLASQSGHARICKYINSFLKNENPAKKQKLNS